MRTAYEPGCLITIQQLPVPSSNLSVTYLLSEVLKLLTLLPSRTAAYAIRKRKQFGSREEEFVQNYHRPGTTALCYDYCSYIDGPHT